jgi:hypothetical protein
MNTTLHNITEPQRPFTTSGGYKEIKLLNIHHADGGYHVLGPLPITREVESALRLWLPSLDPDFVQLREFAYLGIRSALAFRFFWELLAVWRGRGGTAITFEDTLEALNNALQPGRPVVLRWGAEARYGAA